MIEAKNISKSFGNHHVLKDISLIFEAGKTNLIIGRSGSGKTVLQKCLVGLVNIDEGDIVYDNRVFSKMTFNKKKELRQEIGMLFQGGALFDSLTVEENVMFPLTMFTNDSESEKLARVNFCLEKVQLKDTNSLFPSELSGGMVKRVAIARAISMNPKYLFCDEPNSGLDPCTAIVIDKLISEITKEFNMVTIINTHDMNSVFEIGEKVVYIHEGQLWWEGSKDNILHTDNQELNTFVYATELLKKLKTDGK